jgi:protein TonB
VRRDWQISVVAAIVCHVAALFGLRVTLSHPAHLMKDSAVEVTLVAAPAAEPIVPAATAPEMPAVPVVKLTPPVEVPKPILPPKVIIRPEPTPAPEQMIVPVTTHPTASVASSASPPVSTIKGDGSSPEPGLDATTQKAQVGVKARPNYLKNPEPPYPLTARRRREQGLVLLAVRVNPQGRAVKVELKQSSGYPSLDEAALTAVGQWEFEPARIGSITVESEIEVPVRFKLSQ